MKSLSGSFACKRGISASIFIVVFCLSLESIAQTWQSSLLSIDSSGKLVYHADSMGNKLPDFSGVGYTATKMDESYTRSNPAIYAGFSGTDYYGRDATDHLQSLIDEVSRRKPTKTGLRGIIYLSDTVYYIDSSLRISASGIILRGTNNKTVFVARGTGRRTLVEVSGTGSPVEVKKTRTWITDAYVLVGSKQINVANASEFRKGDQVMLFRPGTRQWIHDLRMDSIAPADAATRQWQAGECDLEFQRVVVAVKGNTITLDQPVVMAIDSAYGGGCIYKYRFPGRITQVGIENIHFRSEYKSDTDEDHAWSAVSFNRIDQGWVKNSTATYFALSAVHLKSLATHITVDSCRSFAPKSKITGGRRYAFTIDGQLNLVKNCFSSEGRHDYVTGARVCGPNVFYNCRAERAFADTGPHHRWAVGTLYDNITTDGEINAQDRGNWGTGHGWSGVSQVFWNCKALRAAIQDPWVSGRNYVIGMAAKPYPGRLPGRNASVWETGNHGGLRPVSLYQAQLLQSRGLISP
ncbi:MAG: hypothetical protein EOO09_19370 [Chitinophagaceae bacterium]|nr:MAG: hypothetical protein EOO09_19370 [Chitinophagaceae bacterium]